jgi:hypothetical protein
MVKTALAYLAAGRSVVPVAPHCDVPSVWEAEAGRRRLIRWERYQQARATPADVRRWFAGPQPMGLGIVAGAVSGITLPDGTRAGLECVVLHDAAVHRRFVELLATWDGLPLLARLPYAQTPTGGHQYGYLCVEWAAGTVLARGDTGTRPGRRKTAILIDTRGEGDLCVVAPTPEGMHPTAPAQGPVMVRGSWTRMPLITPEARRLLWACARLLETSSTRRGVCRVVPSPVPADSQPGTRLRRVGRVPGSHTDEALTIAPAPIPSGTRGGEQRRPLQDAYVAWLGSWDWEWLVHLTFQEIVHPEAADKRFRRFVMQLNRRLYGRRWYKHGQGIRWVRALEYQRRGALHYHVLFAGVCGLRPHDCVRMWKDLAGIAKIEPIRNMTASLYYLTKYVHRGGELDVEPRMRAPLP